MSFFKLVIIGHRAKNTFLWKQYISTNKSAIFDWNNLNTKDGFWMELLVFFYMYLEMPFPR